MSALLEQPSTRRGFMGAAAKAGAALLGLWTLVTAGGARAAVKHPFTIDLRPLDNGYLLRLMDASYPPAGTTPPITNTEVFVTDSAQAGAVLKAWLDAIKAIP